MEDLTSDDIRKRWRDSAHYWEKHRANIERMFAPMTDAMMQDAGIQPSDGVLDVAGGTGEPSLTIIGRLGSSVLLVTTDVVFEMVKAGYLEAERRAHHNICFCQCTGQRLPFLASRFDVVVCRLGCMFFPDPPGAFAEMVRVLRPGGRLTLAVWHRQEENALFHATSLVVERYVPSPPEPPDSPGAFRFAEQGKLVGLLSEAGARNVQERILAFHVQAPVTLEEFWTLRSEMSDTLREKISRLSAERRQSLAEEVRESVRPFFATGAMRFPAKAIVVTGRKG